MTRFLPYCAVGVLAVILFACETQKQQSAPAPQAASSTRAASPVGQKPEVPNLFTLPKNDYTYNPVGKRDPFKEYTGEVIEAGPALPRSPLENFELDQFAVTAIVWGISDPRAMIRAPDGQSYILRKDMRVGKNRGRVSRITKREVFVEEEYRDPTGKLVVRESSLAIRPKDTEEKTKQQLRFQDEL